MDELVSGRVGECIAGAGSVNVILMRRNEFQEGNE